MHHAIVTPASGQTGLLCGGSTENSWSDVQSACYYYSPTTDSWLHGPSLNVARWGHGMALYKEKVYVYGGMNVNSTLLSSVEVLTTSGWQLLPFGMCKICSEETSFNLFPLTKVNIIHSHVRGRLSLPVDSAAVKCLT